MKTFEAGKEHLFFARCGLRMLDSKRHGSKGSLTRAFDRLLMQQKVRLNLPFAERYKFEPAIFKVRDALHEILPAFGIRLRVFDAPVLVGF